MTREFKGNSELKINVYFKPFKGNPNHVEAYLAKDMPPQPFGENFETVSFWVDNKLMVYPIDMIEHCEICKI